MDEETIPSQQVANYINDAKKSINDKACLILGIIYLCNSQENHDELLKIKNIIKVSTLDNKDNFISTIDGVLK